MRLLAMFKQEYQPSPYAMRPENTYKKGHQYNHDHQSSIPFENKGHQHLHQFFESHSYKTSKQTTNIPHVTRALA